MRRVDQWKLLKRVAVRRRALLRHQVRKADRAFEAVNRQIAANLEAITLTAKFGEFAGMTASEAERAFTAAGRDSGRPGGRAGASISAVRSSLGAAPDTAAPSSGLPESPALVLALASQASGAD